MIKVYTGELLEGVSPLPLLKPNLGQWTKKSRIFVDKAIEALKEPLFDIVSSPQDADFLLVPHDYFYIENDKEYLSRFSKLSKEIDKKILVFDFSDLERYVEMPNAIVFRMSQYGSRKRANEIIMPAIIEDIWQERKMEPRVKSEKPTIGFCGWAEFGSVSQKIKSIIKAMLRRGAFKQGIYFRRRVLKALLNSSVVNNNFIIRRFYSGHKNTIAISPELARKEFLDNLNNSDLALCVKGDGNYSIRFFEALSAGRVPVFVDTDCILPLDDLIDYKEFMLKIDYKNISNADKIIANFWKNLNEGQFAEMQKKAREAYENYLRPEKFFPLAFEKMINKSKWEEIYYEIADGDFGRLYKEDWKIKKSVDYILKNLKDGQSVLEVGCGVAGLAQLIGGERFYVGVDASDFAVTQAKEKLLNKKNVNIVKADSAKLPFAGQSFNIIYSQFALEHFREPKKALIEMKRVLRPGGSLILIAPNLELPFCYPSALRHKNFTFKLGFLAQRLGDYVARLFGIYSFRTIKENFLAATGKYEKKDDDLVYLASSFEVLNFLKKNGFEIIFANKLGEDKADKNMLKKAISYLPGMRYYGVELFAILKLKN